MAKNFMSSILDELMGRDRDALPTEKPKKINWDDPEMCTFYLVCFCPHELFVNTKADLGPCTKFHDEQMRKKYLEEAPSYKRSIFEAEFIRFAEKMISDIEGKIKRGKMRIALANGPDGGTYAGPGSKNAEKIALLTERINQLLQETEAAGCDGDVEKAQGLMKLCDQLKDEREQLKSNEVNHPWNPDKAMQVCEVCGSYLIIGEAQHRLDDHIMGKQHVGFAMLRKNLEEVRKAKEKRDQEDRERIQKEREKRFGRTSRDHDSSGRGDRHRSRDYNKPRTEEKKDDKGKDDRKERDRDDKDKRHRHRSRSGDRKKDKSGDDKDKEGRSRHRSRSSERKDKDKDKERDKDKKDKHRERDRSRDSRHRRSSRDRDRKHSKRSRSRSKDRDRSHSHKKSRSDRERDDKKERVKQNEEVWDEPQPDRASLFAGDSNSSPMRSQNSNSNQMDTSTNNNENGQTDKRLENDNFGQGGGGGEDTNDSHEGGFANDDGQQQQKADLERFNEVTQ